MMVAEKVQPRNNRNRSVIIAVVGLLGRVFFFVYINGPRPIQKVFTDNLCPTNRFLVFVNS